MSELKPCPLCGGTASIAYGKVVWAVVCPCSSHVFYGAEQDPQKTVEAWNTRAERTCRDLGGCDEAGMQVFNCSECGCVLSLFDVSGTNTLCTSHIYDYPRFCLNCGAKVGR